jgi:hypothetical protein
MQERRVNAQLTFSGTGPKLLAQVIELGPELVVGEGLKQGVLATNVLGSISR